MRVTLDDPGAFSKPWETMLVSIVGRLHTKLVIIAASKTTATCQQWVCGVPADSAAVAKTRDFYWLFLEMLYMSKQLIALGGALVFFGGFSPQVRQVRTIRMPCSIPVRSQTVSATVVAWHWTNPHVFLEVVDNTSGMHWDLESASHRYCRGVALHARPSRRAIRSL